MIAMWLIIIGVAAVLGVLMLGVGLRGRRVDDHPHCRGCGFDLFGKPDAANCPECGRDLASPTSIRMGRRERRTALAGSGGALLAFALIAGGTGAWLTLSGMDMQPYKPVWWLISELTSPPDQMAAVGELDRRLRNGELADGQVASVVSRILTVQADTNQNWLMAFGDFIELARQNRLVDDAQFKRYLEQGVTFELAVRPKVRVGDPVGYREATLHRLGSGSANLPRLWLRFEHKHFALSGHKKALGSAHGSSLGGGNHGWSSGSFSVKALTDGEVPVAEHPCELVGRASVRLDHDGPTLHEWDVTIRNTVQIVPRDVQTVELIDDPDLATQVEQSLKVDRLTAKRLRSGRWHTEIELKIDERPVGLAHRIIVVQDGKRHDLGAISKPGDGSTTWHLGSLLDGPVEAGPVQVIMEPDIDKAHSTVDVFDLWNRPIVIEGVEVVVEEETQ